MKKEKKYTDAEILGVQKPKEDFMTKFFRSAKFQPKDKVKVTKVCNGFINLVGIVKEIMLSRNDHKTWLAILDFPPELNSNIKIKQHLPWFINFDDLEHIKEDKPKFKVGGRPDKCCCAVCKNSWWNYENQLELITEEYEPITPENILEVLKYNGIKKWWIDHEYRGVENSTYLTVFRNPKWLQHRNLKWLQHLEREVGKLKPLPKKEPALEEALIELGFEHMYENKYNKNGKLFIRLHLNGKNYIVACKDQCWIDGQELVYTTKEQLAKDIAAFEEKHKEPTFEEALSQLGFKKEDSACCHTKGRLAICTGKFQEIYIRKRVTETQEPITYTTKEQLIKDIADFEKKNRAHWSLVDDGGHGKEIGRLHRDKVENTLDDLDISNALYGSSIGNKWGSYYPAIYSGNESDFGILCNDGSLIKAFWRGAE